KTSTILPPFFGVLLLLVLVVELGPHAARSESSRSEPPNNVPIDCQRLNQAQAGFVSPIVPLLLRSDDERALEPDAQMHGPFGIPAPQRGESLALPRKEEG